MTTTITIRTYRLTDHSPVSDVHVYQGTKGTSSIFFPAITEACAVEFAREFERLINQLTTGDCSTVHTIIDETEG